MSAHEVDHRGCTARCIGLARAGSRLDISGVKKPKVALLPLLTPLDEAAKDTAITSIIGRG
ncbi:hypothetical protein [Rhizobium lentis]|uniref:Uncharacterized protein n=1 Tax=Rhizobium lentis TaxID=1138194 RepID=A0A7W8UM42_9HYPH|nr:hypothetical protein [Rhizobium lentis]MBB4573560.1 hypothetical protein [Rhizobium lentis]MBB5549488.1 hypothetical protein [Rhizobium lentis]MBB5560504.1 hypothetical protein [Rhizobium lentis]MBB5566608.1 hypothetical protein [Rhizobium lentis]